MLTPFQFGYSVKQALDGLGAKGMPGMPSMPKSPQAARPSLAAAASPAKSPAQIPKPAAAQPTLPPMGPSRKAYEQHAQQRVMHQFGGPASQPADPSQWADITPEQQKLLDQDVSKRVMNQFGGGQGLLDAMGQFPQQ